VRVVFFGTPDIAVPTLAAVAAGHQVVAVVCQPDRPRGRSKKALPPPVKVWAQDHGVPVHQPTKLNDGTFEAWLREQRPDVSVVAAYGRLLKQPLLDVPTHGHLNMHPSLLPRWRGASPIQSAVMAGDQETGVTIMRLTLEMDAGDMLLQERTPIDANEDAVALSDRLARLGAEMMLQALRNVELGTATYTPQDDAAATHCKMLRKEDGFMNWARPALELHNLVRGVLPWPIAQCGFQGQTCRILQTEVLHDSVRTTPGTITGLNKHSVDVAAGEGQLRVLRFQAPGKKAMAMGDYLRGSSLKIGDRFDSLLPAEEDN
jgi:methionyl-tRNA formyltransferase